IALLAAALGLSACGSGGPAVPKTVALANTARASANTVTVSPLPGTGDASASTQISFLGDAETTVSYIRVAGSLTGRHRGRLERYSTGTGESFLPARRFAAGERVSVTAR